MKNKRSPRVPLARSLVERHAFVTVQDAARWIMAGDILVNGQCIDKPGTLVSATAELTVRGRHDFASRGGIKLDTALRHFTVDVAGHIALDCGASTGGFTDCLLQHGASVVYAVEAGHGQLTGKLRNDPRVRNLEHTNLGDISPASFEARPSIVTLDLSYLSLRTALPIVQTFIEPGGQVIALFKPLFEVDDAAARRSGVINQSQLIISALIGVIMAAGEHAFGFSGLIKLALQPKHGVHEWMLYFIHSNSGLTIPTPEEVGILLENRGTGPIEDSVPSIIPLKSDT